MPVRMQKFTYRRTAQQKCFEHTGVHHLYRPCLHAFIVVFVMAEQVRALIARESRVKVHANEIREYLATQHFGKSLAFGNIFLAVAFYAMTENLMKKNRG